jgi:hypothetical protein
MNALNALDVLVSLLLDEEIDVMASNFIPPFHLPGMEESVKAAHEELNLYQGVLSQAFVLFAKMQVVSHLWEKVVSTHRGLPGKDVALETSGAVCPAEETMERILDGNVMTRFESRFFQETLAGFGPRLMTHPVIGKVNRHFRAKLL